ncbi:S8 family serine peptidase [Streptomyces sp. NPDC051133]|uniref:S8 family serine peptidase n=1 Tax=Streptomyces sp. NPDC051133 TaxID=3155521 RepID=UPI00343B8D2A
MIQLRPEPDVVAAVIDPQVSTTVGEIAGELPGIALDPQFEPVAVPRPQPAAPGADPLSLESVRYSMAPEHAGVVVRGEIQDYDVASRYAMLSAARRDIVGIFSDPVIETLPTCGGEGPVGDWHDIQNKLTDHLKSEGMDGDGVALAILDTGINVAHVTEVLGQDVTVDEARSWKPDGVTGTFGRFPVDHGSMCAFDTRITAPRATLLDLPILRPKPLLALLTDAVKAFAHLRTVLDGMPQERRALVVSNSWGSFDPRGDFPPGHPGNYSDNPAHPFNLAVSALVEAGADVLFAAGNCGRECPDVRCAWPDRSINGANSHPSVLSIGGVDLRGARVGYSSQGPGRLSRRKPDVCTYTHFAGSKAFGPDEPDSGTSAACPVAAGVVAAVRSQLPVAELSPAELRVLLRRTADDLGMAGFDFDYGYGTIDAAAIVEAVRRRRKNGRHR